jgi:glycosyltransferase involved in cell wall biosynthesis
MGTNTAAVSEAKALPITPSVTSSRFGVVENGPLIEASGHIRHVLATISADGDGHEFKFDTGEKWVRVLWPINPRVAMVPGAKAQLHFSQAHGESADFDWVAVLGEKAVRHHILASVAAKPYRLANKEQSISLTLPSVTSIVNDDKKYFASVQVSKFPARFKVRYEILEPARATFTKSLGFAATMPLPAAEIETEAHAQVPAAVVATRKPSRSAGPNGPTVDEVFSRPAPHAAPESLEPKMAPKNLESKVAPQAITRANEIVGFVNIRNPKGVIGGWVADQKNPKTRLTVLFEVDGQKAGAATASLSRADLEQKKLDGNDYGFRWELPLRWQDGRPHQVRVLVEKTGLQLTNSPVMVETSVASRDLRGAIEAPRRGTTICGWAQADLDAFNPLKLRIVVDGQPIGEVLANLYRPDLERKAFANCRAGFELVAPHELFDGKPHKLEIVDVITGKILAEKTDQRFSSNKNYGNYEEFRRWSFFHREMAAPFTEADKRVLAYLDWKADHCEQQWRQRLANGAVEPLVSIIMPTYNRADLISLAVDSVLEQSYQNWELVIVDDCSTDATEEVLETYQDPRINIVKLKTNNGVSAARNFGIKAATGEFIAYLDSDNKMDRRFLSVMIGQMLEKNSKAAYCAQYLYKTTFDTAFAVRLGEFNPGLLENRNFIDLNTYVHTRELYKIAGGFNEELRRFVDWDLIIRHSHETWPLYIDCVLSHYLYNQAEGTITVSSGAELAYSKFFETAAAFADQHVPTDDEAIGGRPVLYRDRKAREVRRDPAGKRGVSVVIPSFNIPDILDLAVKSILGEAFPGTQVVIVDNASDSKTIRYLRNLEKSSSNVVVKYNRRNEGFSLAVNQGIKLTDSGNDVVIMNNDAIGTEGWLWRLCEARDNLQDFGILAPTQYLLPHTRTFNDHQPAARPDRDIEVNISHHHNNLVVGSGKETAEQSVIEALFVPFFCVLIRREALGSVGLLDEIRGRHYRSDRIYCDALRYVGGYKIGVCYKSRVYHLLQQSTSSLRKNNPEMYEVMFKKNSWSDKARTSSPWE